MPVALVGLQARMTRLLTNTNVAYVRHRKICTYYCPSRGAMTFAGLRLAYAQPQDLVREFNLTQLVSMSMI